MAIELFQKNPYLRACSAVVVECNQRARYFTVNQTVFYPQGGGQPGSTGTAFRTDDSEFEIIETKRCPDSGEIFHYVKDEADLPEPGTKPHLEINWERRYLHMRMHSCLHLLSAVVPGRITGAQIRDGRGRVDFDVRYPQEKHHIADTLNTLIQQEAKRINHVYTREEIESNPTLLKNISVKPPEHLDTVRLVHFENLDIQPCSGTHVANTSEIGEVRVDRIESKGRRNRRISVSLVDLAVEPNY